jgi:Uma2 family endonuclease
VVSVRTGPWTVDALDALLDTLPDDPWARYEILEGELYVSRAPGERHQVIAYRVANVLSDWSERTGLGKMRLGVGLRLAGDGAIPDVIWLSNERYAAIYRDDRLYGAPELVVEVLSPGPANAQRDRETKLRVYSDAGVGEYWLLDWQTENVTIFRRAGGALQLAATLHAADTLTSPLLADFAVTVADLFVWP